MNHIKFVPLSLFAVFALKALIVGATMIDAPLLLIVGLVAAFYEYQCQTQRAKVIQKRLDEVDKHLSSLYKSSNEIKADLATTKLSTSMRQVQTQSPFQARV